LKQNLKLTLGVHALSYPEGTVISFHMGSAAKPLTTHFCPIATLSVCEALPLPTVHFMVWYLNTGTVVSLFILSPLPHHQKMDYVNKNV
jgi:hypothetical protein